MAKKEGKVNSKAKAKTSNSLDLKTVFTILSQPKLSFDKELLKSLEISYMKGETNDEELLPSIFATGFKYGLQKNKGGKRLAEQFIKSIYASKIQAFNKSIQDEKDAIAEAKAQNKDIAAQNRMIAEENKSIAQRNRERKENQKQIKELNRLIDQNNALLDAITQQEIALSKSNANSALRGDLAKQKKEVLEIIKKGKKDLEEQFKVEAINEALDTQFIKQISVDYFTPAEQNKVVKSNDQVQTIKDIIDKKYKNLFQKIDKKFLEETDNIQAANSGLSVNMKPEHYEEHEYEDFEFASKAAEFVRLKALDDLGVRTKAKRKKLMRQTVVNQAKQSTEPSIYQHATSFKEFEDRVLSYITAINLNDGTFGNERYDGSVGAYLADKNDDKIEALIKYLRVNADYISLDSDLSFLGSDFDNLDRRLDYLESIGLSQKKIASDKSLVKLYDFGEMDKALGTRFGDLKFRSSFESFGSDVREVLPAISKNNLKKKETKFPQNETEAMKIWNTKGLSRKEALQKFGFTNEMAKAKVEKMKAQKVQLKNDAMNWGEGERAQLKNSAVAKAQKEIAEIQKRYNAQKISKLENPKPISEQRIQRIEKLPVPQRTIQRPKKSWIAGVIEPATRATKTPAAKKAIRVETNRAIKRNAKNKK